MYIARMARLNPWWKDRAAIGRDPKLAALRASPLGLAPDPGIFEAGDYIYSLRGPRQAGKTTLVKLAIARLLESVRPHNILYYLFESERRPLDVENVLFEYFDKSSQSEESRRYLFLDEISNVIDWQRAIKMFKDLNMLENCTVVTTGSHSVDLSRATELLAGRRGDPRSDTLDRFAMPMNFRRFVMATDRRLYDDAAGVVPMDQESRIALLRGAASGRFDAPVEELCARQDGLGRCLDRYLLAGGLPPAVDRLARGGRTCDAQYGKYMEHIRAAFARIGKDPALAGQIIRRIAECTGEAVSWSSLKDGTSAASHHTAADYAGLLGDMFCAIEVCGYNLPGDRPEYFARKKLYLRDPFFFHMAGRIGPGGAYGAGLGLADGPVRMGQLVEQVVCEHIVRLAYGTLGMRVAYGHGNAVFHWRSRRGREVDFLVRDSGGGMIPIDVRYQDRIRGRDVHGILDYKRASGSEGGILVTKSEAGEGRGHCRLPAPVFLFLV